MENDFFKFAFNAEVHENLNIQAMVFQSFHGTRQTMWVEPPDFFR